MTPRSRRCFTNAHRVHVYHSQREGLSVGQSSSSVSERTGRPVRANRATCCGPSGQELNVGNAQIRTLLDKQKEQILAECQAEIKKHEFQLIMTEEAVQKPSEINESQQRKNFIALKQKNFNMTKDQQLLHAAGLLQQNSELDVKLIDKSLNEMEESGEFGQSSHDHAFPITQVS